MQTTHNHKQPCSLRRPQRLSVRLNSDSVMAATYLQFQLDGSRPCCGPSLAHHAHNPVAFWLARPCSNAVMSAHGSRPWAKDHVLARCDSSTSQASVSVTSQGSLLPEPVLLAKHKELNCVSTGLDVQCVVEEAPAAVIEQASGISSSSTDVPSWIQQAVSASLLVSPFFFWGTSMVAMKGVIPHTTPLFLGSLRLLPAGAALVGWASANGRPHPSTWTAWLWVLAFSVVDGAAFQGFLAEGLQRTSAGLGSVIIDSQPLTVAVLAAILFGEALGPLAVAGLVMGVAGLLLLELPQEIVELSAAGLLDGSAASHLNHILDGGSVLDSGEFWMLLAAQSMALGTVMVRYVTKHCDPVMATGYHMMLGGALLGAACIHQDSALLAQRLPDFNLQDAAAMTYVSLLGGAASYGIFFYKATTGSLTALSSLTFLTPVFAAGAGYMALGETLTPMQVLGAGVTLASVVLINNKGQSQVSSKTPS